MSSRSSRKRPALSSASPITTLDNYEPPTRRTRRDIVELETLQAELEHERSLRALDAKRFVQGKQRLETQLRFAAEEVQEQKSLLEELREEHDRHLDQLRRALKRTKEELLETKEELDEERALASEQALEEDPRVNQLQEDLDAQSTENDQLKETLADLRNDLREMMEKQKSSTTTPQSIAVSSEARPEVLQELNKVRIQLSEQERKTRQYKRIAEESQKKAKDALQEKEKLRSCGKRIEQLEIELKETNLDKEKLQESLRKWQQDLASCMASLPGNPKADLSVLKKYVQETKKMEAEAGRKQKALQEKLEKAHALIQTLESTAKAFGRKEERWNIERKDLEKQHQLLEKDVSVYKGQEDVYKREVESLRKIVKTFDDLPLGNSKAAPANLRVLEVSLQAAKDQVVVLKEAKEAMHKDLADSVLEKQGLQTKHNAVLEKFGKLRDALYAERSKAEKAMERANEAEILAGKGSFNPNTTRVLHLSHNPLTMALKDEIAILKKQLEVSGQKGKKYLSDVDPNKLHQRLKQSFKEQISRFREGVYLMTGYKVDMIPENDRYKFKVRSVFAERERDYLLFQWPEGKDVTSLDLLNTEYAKLLTKSPSYEYMTKFHSLPAFLASAQLTLFEKQTMM
eukprot:CAMPEP_0116102320 /NCGR_PEP_ID=MMETSP0327-20121206/13283_1 /TAXON_ID=44447 /ORGANISM="Pseudo-nitzschia delicatissima, Strain B596" /LENGTH=630 /DNA_ID=CAMNT_0003594345 /DNA_START=88 /DNA_END=1980 /DNA_ORIENTATION=+